MSTILLRYTPLGGSLTLKTLPVLAVRGGGEPDAWLHFPGLQHHYLDGSSDQQNKGLIRRFMLDFGVIAAHADRVAILDFLLAADAEIEPTIAAPTNLSAVCVVGGSLPINTYYYKVTAVDAVGETVGSTQASVTTAPAYQKVNLTWTSVSGAVLYKIYRSTTSGVPGSTQFLGYATSASYTDDGTVSLKPGAVPTSAAIKVMPEDGEGYENEWLNNVELGRYYVLRLRERVMRTYHV